MIGSCIVSLLHSQLLRFGMVNVAVWWVWNVGIPFVLWERNRALTDELGV